jgi:sarcosine oxidase subunit beta
MRLCGVDAELLDVDGVRRLAPMIDVENPRFPVQGGLLQPRGGTVRHDAVAWGYARAADKLGVHIIQNCEVTGLVTEGERVVGVETGQGRVMADKVGLAVAGHTSQVGRMAGLDLPIETHVLQAFVSEGLKPFIDTVVTFGAGHFYISQSDKGGLVFGGDLDGYNTYAQRGNLPTAMEVITAGNAMIPSIGRVRLLRQWGGRMDMTMDGSPIISPTPVPGLFLNGGWCYGGFKATPASGWCFADTIANDEPHDLVREFTIDRFREGRALDEKGVGPRPWIQ